ncbi:MULTISPECIES: Gfo/Idh/MocA family protein [Micrococcaceae]|uniref:Gfo/Idh/MocA family protein n=1 Tax=Micrococcaceae TaxID=1268 RepID=UPI0012FBE09F|nr:MULTISPECIES: Gfo/Idh/MocA family oxidoreductase [Pseudarthrobacter]MEA3551691.1 Gfo/Idh/MocA family oxidoreductase [Pseudarthrobacter sp. C1]MUU70899.1 gfo/Idh/MocA family oxidoreductase [Pseudarthrobacter sp. GA104]WPU10062.1 Gfo/Idh/MocA family oxidoreductase [Pseudarthrobacter oxydans]HET7782504.1 Gfo/Idh/MocA family oxidoreductase [Arthrobacter sp.]
MSETLKVAITGCGVIGRTHAVALQEFPGASIVALVDAVPDAAVALADFIEKSGRPRPSVHASLADAFAAADIDLVALATPSGLHIQQGLEVLAAGKHVVIEKPLDVDLSRAQEIEAAANEAARRGVVASVISQHRFDQASVAVADAVAKGRFGRLTSAIASVAWWRGQGYYDSGDWRGTWSMDGGGALMNQGVHTVDLLLWFMGRPVEIHAHTARLAHERIEVEDTAVATVTFENGGLAVLHATTAAYPGLTVRVQLMGSEGSAVVDNDQLHYFHAKDAGGPSADMGLQGGGNQAREELAKYPAEDYEAKDPTVYPAGHIRQYRDILGAITEGRQPGVTVSDAVNALAAVRAVYVSATLNQAVLFDDVLAGKYNDLEVRTGSTATESA